MPLYVISCHYCFSSQASESPPLATTSRPDDASLQPDGSTQRSQASRQAGCVCMFWACGLALILLVFLSCCELVLWLLSIVRAALVVVVHDQCEHVVCFGVYAIS